jgi:hypothetical protein
MLMISLLITISGFQPLRTHLHLPGAMPQAFSFRALGATESIFSPSLVEILDFEAKQKSSPEIRLN